MQNKVITHCLGFDDMRLLAQAHGDANSLSCLVGVKGQLWSGARDYDFELRCLSYLIGRSVEQDVTSGACQHKTIDAIYQLSESIWFSIEEMGIDFIGSLFACSAWYEKNTGIAEFLVQAHEEYLGKQ
jgi:hypothetical protein